MTNALEGLLAANAAAQLTDHQQEALRSMDPDMFDGGKVHAHGPVMAALRKRGIVEQAPHCHLTVLGQEVAKEVRP